MVSPGSSRVRVLSQSVTCTDGTPCAGPRSTAMAQAPAVERGGKVVVRGGGSLFGGGHGGCVSQVRGNREDAFGCGRRGRGASAERLHIPVEKLGSKARRRWSQHDSRMDEGGCGFGPKVVKYANRSWISDLRVRATSQESKSGERPVTRDTCAPDRYRRWHLFRLRCFQDALLDY